jgi:hypothetical protein
VIAPSRVVIPPVTPPHRRVTQPPGPARFVTELPMPHFMANPRLRPSPAPPPVAQLLTQAPAPPPAPPAPREPSVPARPPSSAHRRPALELPARSRLVLQRRVVIPPRELVAGRVVARPHTITLAPVRRVMS